MLSNDPAQNRIVVDDLRTWHRDNNVAVGAKKKIDYGWYGKRKGAIELSKGQFTVTSVTKLVSGKEGMVEVSYNHSFGSTLTMKKVEEALTCADLAGDKESRAIVICMTSECARSEVVDAFFRALLGEVKIDDRDFVTLQFLVKNYSSTLEKAKKSIAPGPNWQPLTIADYRTYLTGQQDKDKLTYLEQTWSKIERH